MKKCEIGIIDWYRTHYPKMQWLKTICIHHLTASWSQEFERGWDGSVWLGVSDKVSDEPSPGLQASQDVAGDWGAPALRACSPGCRLGGWSFCYMVSPKGCLSALKAWKLIFPEREGEKSRQATQYFFTALSLCYTLLSYASFFS